MAGTRHAVVVRMKYLSIVLFTLSGCATAHDYCVDHAEHYGSYQECYAERTERSREHRHQLAHAFDSDTPTHVNCTSTTFGNTTDTNCR